MITKKRLGDLLVENVLMTEAQLKHALGEQKKQGVRLGRYLIKKGIVSESQIIEMLCQQLRLSRYSPGKYQLDFELAKLIPYDTAEKGSVVPLQKKGRLLTVAMVDPLDIATMDAIEGMTRCEIDPVICTEAELQSLLNNVYSMGAMLGGVMDKLEIAAAADDIVTAADSDVQVGSLKGLADAPPVIRLVNSIFHSAIKDGASDLHISPKQDMVQVRYRIDGRLHEMPSPPKTMFNSIVARIKIMSNMDITVSRVPQDGRFTIRMGDREINVRASVVPTIYGENIVMRLLDLGSGTHTLGALGMSESDIKKIKTSIQKPHGMVLSTGPTGSGKSTSLYSIIGELNTPDVHILTLEDPVEYRMNNVRQVQLNEKAGMTFASGLRALLRQDPDIIMIGEIRDAETASIAVRAAQTGHMLLSTMHTNDSAGAVARLVDMGIEPFLVASTLLMSFAQRLLRTSCTACAEPYSPPKEVLAAWGLDKVQGADFKRGRGCYSCLDTGYKGRVGIFEVMVVDDAIHDMIVQGKSSKDITREAVAAGKMRTLKQDAMDKILRGITTLEEAESMIVI
jgi:type IV pilus assembly protein PilB